MGRREKRLNTLRSYSTSSSLCDDTNRSIAGRFKMHSYANVGGWTSLIDAASTWKWMLTLSGILSMLPAIALKFVAANEKQEDLQTITLCWCILREAVWDNVVLHMMIAIAQDVGKKSSQ